jgi:hypothetical protein
MRSGRVEAHARDSSGLGGYCRRTQEDTECLPVRCGAGASEPAGDDTPSPAEVDVVAVAAVVVAAVAGMRQTATKAGRARRGRAAGQGHTLVHFSAQPEPFLLDSITCSAHSKHF